jgi:threonine dehydratase
MDAQVYLKLESELPTGSFKVRGALYALNAEMERRTEGKFGAQYLHYKASVRRWL